MRFFKLRQILATLSLLCLALPTFGGGPAPEALSLIEELGLSQSSTPVKRQPDWKPERIVVMVMPEMSSSTYDFEANLQQAAEGVELVLVHPDNFKQLPELLAGADAVIGYCNANLLKDADPKLRWIHSYYAGMDHCKGASESQLETIVFSNNQRLAGPAIAEHAIAMLMALTHNLPAYLRAQDERKWQRQLSAGVTFGELKGKTLLVVGLGGIGTEIAWRAHGLGMRVIATRNSSREGPDFVESVGLAAELHNMAGKADVIVNALPLTPQTTGVFNKLFFEATKPGAIFLSVGRGESTVTSDLIAALESGKLFGAGLDVTDPEPLPKNSPLWSLPNVIITPHVSSAGVEGNRRTMIIAVENLRRYTAGEPLLNVVDISRGY
jgi:phosphoglycerate dehydrogenase-like enzyme